ncbi:MAG: NHL repeat-containing protein [bacterium]
MFFGVQKRRIIYFFIIFLFLSCFRVYSKEAKFLFSFSTKKIVNGREEVIAKGRTLYFNSSEKLYVVVPEVREIWVFDKKGNFISSFGEGLFIEPSGIAIDHNDMVYISDLGKDIIFVFSEQGQLQRQFPLVSSNENLKKPCAPFIAFNKKDKRLYSADACNHKISVYSPDGKLVESFGRMGATLGEFSGPANIAFDGEGSMYIVDPGNFRIQSLTSTHTPRFGFGESGVREGRFIRPYGIVVGKEGSIIVSDFVKADIQVFNTDGSFRNVLGKGTVFGSVFKQPLGIALSKDNKLYIVDGEQRRIYVFQI